MWLTTRDGQLYGRIVIPPRNVVHITIDNGVACVLYTASNKLIEAYVEDDEALYALALRVYNDLRVTGEIG